ncbi:leucyl aminopeptidase [Geovibrio thiophilus]|uniref:Probable cytosol aminopeptidase n=1 Tax=Geovibrio thiophilus TaxID=139438 RepID=A0A3R5X4K2_9BACT|nr:leucyl aminopeptidase [Geovibrio thiophilus]QAR34287.1 leucyl aminopeptidase [Geovibrio thiophilus]
MKISCRKKTAFNSRKEAVIIPVYKNMGSLKLLTGKRIDDEIANIVNSDYFNFEDKEIKSFYIDVKKKLKRIFLVNVPKDPEDYRYYLELGAQFSKIIRKDKLFSFSLVSFEDIYAEKKEGSYTKSFLEGLFFGLYSFERYKSKKESFDFEEVEVITTFTKLKKFIDAGAERWATIFQNVYLARDLINTPPMDMTPAIFAETVRKEAGDDFAVTVYDEVKIKEEGLNLIDVVGMGSVNKPRFVMIDYKGDPGNIKHIALVGKGVTFDSGGSNLKPTGSMETMKCDMAGAATVFAVTKLVRELKLPVNIRTYIPLVENMIGGGAYRPGDVITSASGKTVEVLNTDAEGRLILADALYTATQTDPEVIVDVATLTGACVVALGSHCAGLFSNRKFLAKNISDLSGDVGEDIWELPLLKTYEKRIKSDIADLRNIARQRTEAGSTIAALFLREFVDNWPWIHLDIAGPAYLEEEHPVFGKHASGFGIRLLLEFIERYYCRNEN